MVVKRKTSMAQIAKGSYHNVGSDIDRHFEEKGQLLGDGIVNVTGRILAQGIASCGVSLSTASTADITILTVATCSLELVSVS